MLHLGTITCIKGRELNPPGLIPIFPPLKVLLFQLWGTLTWRGHVVELRSIWFIMFTYGHLGGSGHSCHIDSFLTGVPALCFVQLVSEGKIIGCFYLKPLPLSLFSEWNLLSFWLSRSRQTDSCLLCILHHLVSYTQGLVLTSASSSAFLCISHSQFICTSEFLLHKMFSPLIFPFC